MSPPPAVAEVDDAPRVVGVDPSAQHVREAEAIGGAQRLEVLDDFGRRLVVVGHPRIERQPL